MYHLIATVMIKNDNEITVRVKKKVGPLSPWNNVFVKYYLLFMKDYTVNFSNTNNLSGGFMEI